MRLIATEEAFAPKEYLREFLKLAERVDTPGNRYLKVFYGREEMVRQLTDLDYRIEDMDRHGVDMHVLSITAPGAQAFDAELGGEIARIANDTLAAEIARRSDRFAGLATIAPQDPAAAAREAERAVGKLGLGGIIINSHTHGEWLDDPKFWPIFEAAVALDVPIYLHPAFPPESMAAPYADYGMMGALWGFGAECSLHVVRMIMGGVFDAFPTLKIVLGHLGEAVPFWLDRLDNRYQNILRRGGLGPLGMKQLQRLPSEYFRTNFWITTSGMRSTAPLEFCLGLFGAERVMFAIDYPFEQTAEAVPFIHAAPLDAEARRLITHANAEALFRIAPL